MNLILTFQVHLRDYMAQWHREVEAQDAACKKERDDRLAAFILTWPDPSHETLVLRTQNRSPRNLNLQKLYSPGRHFLDRVFNGLDPFHDDVPDKGDEGCEEDV